MASFFPLMGMGSFEEPLFSRCCINCGSYKTSIRRRKNRKPYAEWFKHEDGFLCRKCKFKLVYSPKHNPILNSIHNPKRLRFKEKRIILKDNPRTGQCSKCLRKIGEGIKKTAIHHIHYHNDNPLKDTIELCVSCHRKQHI